MVNFLRKKGFTIFLAYLLLIVIIYPQVVLFNKSLLPSLYYPSKDFFVYSQEGRKPMNTFNIDLASSAFYEQPINRLVGKMYLKGQLPLWNPYQGCGVPLAAQYSTRAFFPYQILENISPYWMWDYFMLGRLVIAAFFTYLFLKLLGLTTLVSFLGGIFYMLSGSMVWFINNEQFMDVAMTVPIIIFFFEKMIINQDNLYLVLSSIAVALVLLSGQPEIALYVLLLAATYYFFRTLINIKSVSQFLKNLLRFFIIFFLGLGMAAIIILPFLEYVPNSYNCHPPGGTMGNTEGIPPLALVIGLLMPHIFEFPTELRYFPHNGVWDYLGGYLGVLMVYLFLSSLFFGKSPYRKYLFFFTGFGLLVILKNFGCPLILWIGRLPLFDQASSQRWAGPVWTFSLACAGAIGLEIILKASKNKKLICWLSALFLLILISFFYLLALKSGILNAPFVMSSYHKLRILFSESILYGMGVTLVTLITSVLLIVFLKNKKAFVFCMILLSIFELWFYIPQGIDLNWMKLKLIIFGIGILTIFAFINDKRKLGILGLLIAWIVVVFVTAYLPKGFPERVNPFFKNPYIKFLQQQKGYYRVVGGNKVLMPNFASAFRIFDARYIDSLSPAVYQNYVDYHLQGTPYPAITDRLFFTGLPDRFQPLPRSLYEELNNSLVFYSFIGVKYILAPSDIFLNLPLVYDNDIKIYLNPYCLPRVFIAHQIAHAASYIEAQNKIGEKNFDLRNIVVLEENIPKKYNNFIDSSQAEIKEYYPSRVVIKADLKNPGILVLTDVFYPGWKAYVDKREVKIYRVNGLVRGVLLEEGSHTIVFNYFPNSFKIGLYLGVFCLVLCFFILCRSKPLIKVL